MASKGDTSSGLGWKDVLGNLVAFEEINRVQLEIRMSILKTTKRTDLAIAVVAHEWGTEVGAVPPLGSANVTILGTRMQSLEGALIHALYLLDKQLADYELSKTERG